MSTRSVEREPAHVAIIFDTKLRVRACSHQLRASLQADRYKLARRPEGLLVYFDAGSARLSNPSLTVLLQRLAADGVAFALDYKQGWSPADVVSMLIESGTEFSSPTGCGFDGTLWWLYDLPVIGH
jgi:hypothetical protein